jgi:hypothetical protein
MNEDNLNPDGTIKTLWNNRNAKFPFNNRGEVGDGGDDGGDGGDGGDAGGDTGGGTATLTGDWREHLDPTIKDHPALANFKTPADVAKSYVNAQELIGRKGVPLPSKEADPLDDTKRKDWDTVYDTLGRPSDPKAYELPEVERPEGFPADPPEMVDGFKQFAHKIGLLPHQVKALYQWQHEQGITTYKQSVEQMQQAMQQSEAALRQEYGKAFDGNLAGAKGLLQKFGDPKLMETLEATGMGNNPDVVRFLVKVAKQFGEDGNVLVGETQSGTLSPAEARLEVDKIMADKKGAYWNPTDDKGRKQFSDAEHKAMVKKVHDLMQMAHPEKQ